MLEHLSTKFRSPPQESLREPRAALILNRFTRTLSVMYATSAVSSILGISPEQVKHKSFYECIQENCLPEAIRCLESAKANDSIAYLRFWFRDPSRGDEDTDEDRHDTTTESSDSDGGVSLSPRRADNGNAFGNSRSFNGIQGPAAPASVSFGSPPDRSRGSRRNPLIV